MIDMNNMFNFNPQTDSETGATSASVKKNFIDQYFGVEFETSYPLSIAVISSL